MCSKCKGEGAFEIISLGGYASLYDLKIALNRKKND